MPESNDPYTIFEPGQLITADAIRQPNKNPS